MAFCTEPVFASLANVLGNWENLPSSISPDIKDYKLYDVETKYGLLQVCSFMYLVMCFDPVLPGLSCLSAADPPAEAQRRTSAPLEPELQMVESRHVGAEN